MITLQELAKLCGRDIAFTVVPPLGVFGRFANLTFIFAMGREDPIDLAGWSVEQAMRLGDEDEQQRIDALHALHVRVRETGKPEEWENCVAALKGTARMYIRCTASWDATNQWFTEQGVIVEVLDVEQPGLFSGQVIAEEKPRRSVDQAPRRSPSKVTASLSYVQGEMDINHLSLGTPQQFRQHLIEKVFPKIEPDKLPRIDDVRQHLASINGGKSPSANNVYQALWRLAQSEGHPEEEKHYAATLHRVYREWSEPPEV